jgi:hypothetical protein
MFPAQGKRVLPYLSSLLREVYNMYESSYRIMGDNLGGGEQRATDRHIEITEMSKAINGVTKPIYE